MGGAKRLLPGFTVRRDLGGGGGGGGGGWCI